MFKRRKKRAVEIQMTCDVSEKSPTQIDREVRASVRAQAKREGEKRA